MAAFSLQGFTARANCCTYRDLLIKRGSFIMPRPTRRAKKPINKSGSEESINSPNQPAAAKAKPRAKPKAKPKHQPKLNPQPQSIAIENESMADRYFAIAEKMNTGGAIELAVPFYQQAINLLLCERNNLRQQLPSGQNNPATTMSFDELPGLLEAAQAWEGQQGEDLKVNLADSAKRTESTEAIESTRPSLDSRINELAEELTSTSAQQVLAGLVELETEANSLPASGLSLRGKALMLQGEQTAALASFEAAMALAPKQADLRINTGGARLANGDASGALNLLHQVHREGLEQLNKPTTNALLRNLGTAESQAGNVAAAIRIRHQWLLLNPAAVPLQRWLNWAQKGLEKPNSDQARQEAIAMLKDLHRLAPDQRSVMEALAMALEEDGDYRQASLLYRELLRPATMPPSPA